MRCNDALHLAERVDLAFVGCEGGYANPLFAFLTFSDNVGNRADVGSFGWKERGEMDGEGIAQLCKYQGVTLG